VSRPSPYVIVLDVGERARLEAVVRKRTSPVRDVQRAWMVLLAADGVENVVIADRLGVVVNTVSMWRKRFFEERFEGLTDRHRSGRPRTFPPSGGR